MPFKLPETIIASKSLKMSEFNSKAFNLNDSVVPEQLRNAYLSQNSPSPSAPKILSFSTLTVDDNTSIEFVVTKETTRQYHNISESSLSDVHLSDDDNMVDEVDSWEMAKMCPNGCNCGKCPLVDENEEINSRKISILSLAPNLSSISFIDEPNKSASYLSITYVIPLRNYGAIIRWNVINQHGIRGYKIFMDGIQVSSVHSPSRMSAVIENVNMKIPHHFAVSITPTISEKIPTALYHNMHAVYLYKPNNFIH